MQIKKKKKKKSCIEALVEEGGCVAIKVEMPLQIQ